MRAVAAEKSLRIKSSSHEERNAELRSWKTIGAPSIVGGWCSSDAAFAAKRVESTIARVANVLGVRM